jgi:uncharacterized protein YciI
MKHFIIDITYTAPDERIGEVRPAHRAFLQGGYEQGWLLCSGPKQASRGGMVVARAPSLDEITQFFAQDPYAQEGVATHTVVEFDPVMRQEFLEQWTRG